MRKQIFNVLIFVSCIFLLSACNTGLFDKDNTPPPKPLTKITPTLKPHRLWWVKAGVGVGDQ